MARRVNDPHTGRIAALKRRYEPLTAALGRSDTAKAAGLAVAMIANNVIALGSTIVFSRLLSDHGSETYGSLAALVSYFLILAVVGMAMQVATAREGVLGHLGVGPDLLATLKRWSWTMLWVTLAITVISILLRDPIAQAVGVKQRWAAAIGLPAGCMWLELSILRGALQGVGDYKSVGISLVGEQSIRLVTGAALAGAGLGVTGAYLGTPISFVAMGIFCAINLQRRVAELTGAKPRRPAAAVLTLWTHVKRAWAPIAGLIVIAVLQNIDLIAAKHRFDSKVDNSYAAIAVAAKVLIWVAIGAGFYLVPEVSRRRAKGEETRPVLLRALAIILVCAVPALLIFAVAAKPLLRITFGADRLQASGSLFVLGVAFTVLACTYLAIQYMLALKRTWFLVVIGAVAIAEPILLLHASRHPTDFAAVVLGVQAVGATLAFALALRLDRSPPPTAEPTIAISEPTEAEPDRLAARA